MTQETSLTPEEIEVSAPVSPEFYTFDNDPSDPVQAVCSSVNGGPRHCT
ncbi:MAG TPA: hypothetical protein VII22_17615 [Streptosporangiaceae bacterium]|jgi:hypothetical protein